MPVHRRRNTNIATRNPNHQKTFETAAQIATHNRALADYEVRLREEEEKVRTAHDRLTQAEWKVAKTLPPATSVVHFYGGQRYRIVHIGDPDNKIKVEEA
jgi:GTP1/Obg family GTP-binding protein